METAVRNQENAETLPGSEFHRKWKMNSLHLRDRKQHEGGGELGRPGLSQGEEVESKQGYTCRRRVVGPQWNGGFRGHSRRESDSGRVRWWAL